MSKQNKDLQDPIEPQGEFDPKPGDTEEALHDNLDFQEPQFEESDKEEEGEEEEDEGPAPDDYDESDWRFEIQSECQRAMQALNPDFFEARRDLLKEEGAEPDFIPAEITTLFFSPENLLRLLRMSNKGVSWKSREEASIRQNGRCTKVNYHTKWMLLGHAAPQGQSLVPVMCFRNEGKNGESTLEFRVA
jgi:hypothetical protein